MYTVKYKIANAINYANIPYLTMAEVNVSRDTGGRITVVFPYSPSRVAKVKTIEGRKWDTEKKYWVFPDSDGILQKIIQIFDNEELNLDPALGLHPRFESWRERCF